MSQFRQLAAIMFIDIAGYTALMDSILITLKNEPNIPFPLTNDPRFEDLLNRIGFRK